MPRSYRVKSLTYTYHTMIRGVNKEIIFRDSNDKEKFLQIVEYYLSKYEIEMFAYCLMDNHVHFLIKARENLNKFMQCIQTVYALYFNKKYNRIGHLFQDRFKSIPVEEERYLLECVRYIHQNPVKAKMSSIDKYNWSSYNEYIGKSKIINTNYILNLFSNNRKIAIDKYKTYMNVLGEDKDIKNIMIEDKMSDEEAIEYIEKYFNIRVNDIKKYDTIERNIIISKIISLKIISIRQISRITGIDRNIIRRI